MYFSSRAQAGKQIAAELVPKYRDKQCAIVALDDGGFMVGSEIATRLDCIIMLLLSEDIMLPREPDALAGMTSGGDFAFNSRYSSGEIEEFSTEYFGLIEQEKRTSLHDLNRLEGSGSVINRQLLKDKVVILVSDGFKSPFPIDMAMAYLKPVRMEKLVIATPIASVKAVDRMHVAGDELHCLSVVEDFINADHYYDQNDVPEHKEILKMIKNLIVLWQ